MSKKRDKFLITQTLLSSWQYALKAEKGFEDFLKTLKKEPIQQTKAMLDGIHFENVLNATLKGAKLEPTHEWYKPIMELQPILKGSQQQVSASRDITVNGINFVCYGKLDFLKAGVIYDTKFSKTYRVGKYLDSPQHPMYFFLVPEASEFKYLVCDGKDVYTERYFSEDCEPIDKTIKHFVGFLQRTNLLEIFFDKWRSLYD